MTSLVVVVSALFRYFFPTSTTLYLGVNFWPLIECILYCIEISKMQHSTLGFNQHCLWQVCNRCLLILGSGFISNTCVNCHKLSSRASRHCCCCLWKGFGLLHCQSLFKWEPSQLYALKGILVTMFDMCTVLFVACILQQLLYPFATAHNYKSFCCIMGDQQRQTIQEYLNEAPLSLHTLMHVCQVSANFLVALPLLLLLRQSIELLELVCHFGLGLNKRRA